MRPVLTAEQMREADRRTIDDVGLPAVVLMENAGAAVARVVDEKFPEARRPVVLCGKGNNGGDGFVVARRLRGRGVLAILVGAREEVGADARVHLRAYEGSGGPLLEVRDEESWKMAEGRIEAADLLIDALLGTGLHRDPAGRMRDAIARVREMGTRGVPVVAVDLPSGIPSDSGRVTWPAVAASVTVTFAAPKLGHVLPPACDHVGELVIADIGIPERAVTDARPSVWLLGKEDAAAAFGPRAPGANKGDFGRVLVIAGSVGKTGAGVLAATAALRTGAGLVTLATSAAALPMAAAGRPEVMTEPLAGTAAGTIDVAALDRALRLAESVDVVVLGPGLGQEATTQEFVRQFVSLCSTPLVVDADGLNALAAADGGLDDLQGRFSTRPVVLTPHPGEMARLSGRGVREVQAERLEVARELARRVGATVVLKGQRTVVAEAGGRAAVNPTGTPAMATAGTGDVLAGMVGALLARSDAWRAATAAVYVHGWAGELAARRKGEHSLVAGDLLDGLPEAISSLVAEGGAPSRLG